jgi:phosphoglycolate phosphatase
MKNLLFDLDGTIIEPKEGILNSIRHASHKMGVVAPTDEELHQFIGPPIMESFQHKLGLTYEQALEAVGYFRSYYAHTGIHQNALFPYVDELLKALKAEGYTLFVATSKPTRFAKEILKDHHLDELFVEIVGCNMDNSRSDKAEIIAYILENYGLNVSECLMIGDTKYDVIGAQKHGIPSVGVNYGHGDFIKYVPHFTVDGCQELEVLIKKNFPLG